MGKNDTDRLWLTALSECNEVQRRRLAGVRAIEIGRGGLLYVCKLTGMSHHTIIKGMKEVRNTKRLPTTRLRKEGGGRKKIVDKNPDVKKEIENILEENTTGNPMSKLTSSPPFMVGRRSICADSGGSNASRSKLWKFYLQKFVNKTRLKITVCHFPPGTSKWNKIEHKMFSFISMNWKGKPLRNYEIILNLIEGTKTKKGLKIKAKMDEKIYELGKKISEKELEKIHILTHNINPQWNYNIG